MVKRRTTGIVGGAIGLAAAAVAAGLAVEKYAIGRARAAPDLDADQPFGQLPSDRISSVAADDGVVLHIEEVGPVTAPLTVVFVHGYTLNLGSFHFQRAALTETFGDQIRLVFFDQRSHGRSGRSTPEHSTLEYLAADLAAVIATVAPSGPLVLVGHSMGGMAIMELAATQPELFADGTATTGRRSRKQSRDHDHRILAVALMSTSSGGLGDVTLGLPSIVSRARGAITPVLLRAARRTPMLVERGRRMGSDLAWLITRRLSFGGKDVSPAVIEYLHTMIASTRIDVIADFYPALLGHDRLDALAALDHCDVAIVCGEHDVMTPLAHSQALSKALPDAALYIVPGAGHVAMMEQPDVIDGVLEGLINDVLPATAKRAKA